MPPKDRHRAAGGTAGSGVVPVPSAGQSPACAHLWVGCSCHPGLPGSVREEPQPWGPVQPPPAVGRGQCAVGASHGGPAAPRSPSRDREQQGSPVLGEDGGTRAAGSPQTRLPPTGCLPMTWDLRPMPGGTWHP